MKYEDIIYYYIAPYTGLLITIFNALNIYLVMKLRVNGNLTVSKIFILNLSCSDLSVGMMMMLTRAVELLNMRVYSNQNQALRDIKSFLFKCLVQTSVFCSVFNLIALTVDRYLAACHPLQHRLYTRSIAIKISISTWFASISIILSIYFILLFEYPAYMQYVSMPISFCIYAALLIFVFTYYKIFSAVRKSKMVVHMAQTEKKMTNSKKKTQREEIAVLKIAIIKVVLFTFCWLPYSVVQVIKLTDICDNWKSCKKLSYTAFVLVLLNSLLNPMIYIYHIRKQLRKNIEKILPCFKHRTEQCKNMEAMCSKTNPGTIIVQ